MAERAGDLIEVEVIYALPDTQILVALKVPRGTTAGEAIACSEIAARLGGTIPDAAAIGIYGKRVAPSTVLREHDRVEVYRSLRADAREQRLKRARGRRR